MLKLYMKHFIHKAKKALATMDPGDKVTLSKSRNKMIRAECGKKGEPCLTFHNAVFTNGKRSWSYTRYLIDDANDTAEAIGSGKYPDTFVS